MLSLRHVVLLFIAVFSSLLFSFVLAQGKSPQNQSQTQQTSLSAPCNKNPIITCPPNLTLCPGADTHPNGTGCAKARPGGPLCEAPIVDYIDRITSEGPCKGERVIQRIWTATDPQDPTVRSFCIQYIYLEDKKAPEINHCPKDTSILSNEKCHALLTWQAPCFSDHCSNFCVKSSHPNGSSFSVGTTRVVFTATDDCGNATTCGFNVNVIANCCNRPPVITCPADFNSCPQDADPRITGIATALASSVHCGTPIIEYHDDTLFYSQCSIRINRNWTAIDPNDHTLNSSCVQKIEMSDVVKPTISCPPNITVKTDADCKALVTWVEPTVSDNCSNVRLTSSHQPNNRFDIGVYTIYYTATDACGNEAGCNFTLTVEANCCNVPPVIICPNDFSSCPQGIDPAVTGRASALKGNKFCTTPEVSYVDRLVFSGPCSTNVERVWTALDPIKNLSASCTQILNLFDTLAPGLTVPLDIVVPSGFDCTAIVTWNDPIASDNCTNSTIESNYRSGDKFPIGTTEVTVIARDACGKSTTKKFNVTVTDNCCDLPPIINCPANYLACPGSSIDPSITGRPNVNPGSSRCTTPILSYSDETISNNSCSTIIRRTWTAVDSFRSELKSTCVQLIELKDTIPPTVICQGDVKVLSDEKCEATVFWIEPTVTDNCSTNFRFNQSHQNGARFKVGKRTIYYSVYDACGNLGGCNFEVEVIENCCKTPPTINCPSHYIDCPNASLDPTRTGQAITQVGINCKNPILSYTDDIINNNNCTKLINRTWTAVDSFNSELKSSCIQVIELKDTIPPTVICPADIKILSTDSCKVEVYWNEPRITDNCSTTFRFDQSHESGALFGIGTRTIYYSVYDACGNLGGCNFEVEVIDNCCKTAPTITCPANYIDCPNASIDPSRTGQASTQVELNCKTPIITYSDEVINSNNCNKLIKRTWTAVDSFKSELNSSCIQWIELKDTIPPTVICPADIQILSTDSCKVEVYWSEPRITDNCSTTFRFDQSHESGALFGIGTRTIYYSVYDACGNLGGCNFQVEVLDNCCNEPPKITAPANFNGCPQGIDPSITGKATSVASKNCGTTIITYRDETLISSACSLYVRRTWLAVDSVHSNLRDSAIQIIELKDTQSPSLTCPSRISVNSGADCKATVNWNNPTTSDNCSNVQLISTHSSGDKFNIGVRTVTYTGTDACGNSSTCSFEIEVIANCCNVSPTISCPSDFRGCPGSIEPSRTGNATATKGNAFCAEPIISHRDVVVHQVNCSLVIDRTWLAIDPNNSSFRDSCIQRIELKDDIKPVILNCPSDMEVRPNADCNIIVNWNIPTATDNCQLLSLSGTHMPGIQLGVGRTKVVYTATDACNNTSTCTFNIDVLNECCNKPPVITCPADYKGCPNTSIAKEITGQTTANKGTTFCNNPVITFTDRVLSTGPCRGAQVIERTWTATDPDFSQYSTSCKQRIELVDNIAPVIEPIADMKINAMGQCEVKVNLPQAQVTDNCGILSITSDKLSGSVFNMGTTRVTYTATDSCGNISSRSFNVIVEGSVISIDCPKDTTIYRVNPYIDGAYYSWSIPKVRHCAPCKDSIAGFIYMGEYAGNRYFCSLSPATWNDAKILCKLNGGDLAKITSAEENQYISSKLMGQIAWIGANDERREGAFEWVDGSQVRYSNWASGQPNNGGGNEDYVELHPNGLWNDNVGNVSREFICKIPCYNITQTEGPKSGSLLPCGTTKITYVASKDGKADTCSFNVKVDCDSISKYCKNGGQYTDILWIDRVSLSTLNNTSGDNKGYAYFGNPCTSLSNGIEYELCVEPGFKTTAYVVYWKMWIDYNQDGVFQTRELFLTGQGSTGLCGRFTLPSSIISGQTRMRVAMSYGKHVSDACGFILYGEVEDYCIDLRKIGTITETGSLHQVKLPVEMKCIKDCEKTTKSNQIEVREQSIQVINSIEVIPNPVIHEMQLLSKGRNVKLINIYNSAGKVIYKKIAPISNKEILDVSQWNDGMYFVSVEFEDQSLVVEKFLIQK